MREIGKKCFYSMYIAATILVPPLDAQALPPDRSPILGVARIEAHRNDPAAGIEVGTAFLIYKGAEGAYLVTANHVVDGTAAIFVHFAVTPDAPPSEAKILVVDENLDLAVLLASPFPADVETLPLQLSRQPGLGDKLFLIGYSVESRTPAVRQSAMSQHMGPEWLLQTQVDEMDSGSPVIFRGGIAGLVKAKDGAYARCTSSSVLAKALEGWQIPFASVPLPIIPPESQPVAAPVAAPREAPPSSFSGDGACVARVRSESGGTRPLFQGPTRSSPVRTTLPEGTVVSILEQRHNEAKLWFRIAVGGGRVSGYLPQADLYYFAGNCSSRR